MEELTALLAQYGLAIVFANVLLAQAGIPLPAVPMLVVAGSFVAEGRIAAAPLAAAIIVASLMGDAPWYLAGRRYGYSVLRTLCRVAIEPDSCVKRTERIFERWGPPSLMVAKYVPGFSTIAPPLAGAMRLGLPQFLAYSTVAAVLWAAAPVALGALFHEEVERALAWLEGLGGGAVAVVAGALAFYIAFKTAERAMLIRFLRMVRISAGELRELMQREPKPVVLDARSALARSLDPRSIPGAVPVDATAPQIVLPRLPPGRDVVVYCS
ncbi:MAG TPA: VTT domain-containing protein [Burkholderiales bacterium]|nr:VTT domain-containing protein [Burkholderiales bacterium]